MIINVMTAHSLRSDDPTRYESFQHRRRITSLIEHRRIVSIPFEAEANHRIRGLSYGSWGFVLAHRLAVRIIDSDASWIVDELRYTGVFGPLHLCHERIATFLNASIFSPCNILRSSFVIRDSLMIINDFAVCNWDQKDLG